MPTQRRAAGLKDLMSVLEFGVCFEVSYSFYGL